MNRPDPFPLLCPRCRFEPPIDGGPTPGGSDPMRMREIVPFEMRIKVYIAHLNEHWAKGEAVGP